MEENPAKVYRLLWLPYLRSLGYLILGELFVLWLLAAIGGRIAPGRFLLALWWLWPGLTITLGLIGRAGTSLVLDGERLAVLIFGVPWQSVFWKDAEAVRLLKVGGTISVLAKKTTGEFSAWSRGFLAEPDRLRNDLRDLLGDRISASLAPAYLSRRGALWAVDREAVRIESAGEIMVFGQASLEGVRFLFVEGDDLPLRLFLYPAGGRIQTIGREVPHFTFLAADILRFAKANAIKVICKDLGQEKPRLPGRAVTSEPSGPRPPRAWEREGWL
ncbi:MAG: hypothetical protein ACM3ZC_07745 [Bacteroidota bacterium]